MAILIETRLNSLKLNENASPRKGCLGRLEGVCADFKNPTRNGRLYPRKLWENVFNDTLFQESLESKTLLGELDHPEDRLEVLAGEACIVMTDYRIDDEEGVIYAGFDILDTPRGKILKSLLDYGCVMGVSSRGQGDITNTTNGEVVDEDTYDFACFDVVTTPAVAKARQNVVESVKKTRTFVESVRKQITEAETVGDLNAIKRVIETTQMPEMDTLIESINNKCKSIKDGSTTTSQSVKNIEESVQTTNEDVTTNEDTTDTNSVSAKTIREAKEMYSCINTLRRQVNAYKFREKQLLTALATKDATLNKATESISKLKKPQKTVTEKLVKENKTLNNELNRCKTDKDTANKKQIDTLKESVRVKEQKISILSKSLKDETKKTKYLRTQLANNSNKLSELQTTINESTALNNELQDNLSNSNIKIDKLEHQLKSSELRESSYKDTIRELTNLKESLTKQLDALESNALEDRRTSNKNINDMENEINSYTGLVDDLQLQVESLKAQRGNDELKIKQLSAKCKQLAESITDYQKIYVNTKSKQLGIDPSLVVQHINNGTSVTQINKLIEDVQKTKDRYAKLPISESIPSGVLIDSTKKQNKVQDEEMEKLATFVEKLAGGR